MTTTVSATATTWTVRPHAGALDLGAESYLYSLDATVTGSMVPASVEPRIDLISVQLSDRDGGSSLAVVYTAGTADPDPVPPAPPSRSLVLAQIPVAGVR